MLMGSLALMCRYLDVEGEYLTWTCSTGQALYEALPPGLYIGCILGCAPGCGHQQCQGWIPWAAPARPGGPLPPAWPCHLSPSPAQPGPNHGPLASWLCLLFLLQLPSGLQMHARHLVTEAWQIIAYCVLCNCCLALNTCCVQNS